MIDLHTHVLPGFDDGVRSVEEAVALVRAAAADGVTRIAATPHVNAEWPTSPERMQRGVARLNAELAAAQVAVEIVPGGELDAQQLWSLTPEELGAFALGGTGRWILLETPYASWTAVLDRTIAALQRDGYGVLLAHPERNPDVQRDPARLDPLVADGVRVQITTASVDGRVGPLAERCAFALLERGSAHVLASDAHDEVRRPIGFASALAALGDDVLGQQLTQAAPAAILAGLEV